MRVLVLASEAWKWVPVLMTGHSYTHSRLIVLKELSSIVMVMKSLMADNILLGLLNLPLISIFFILTAHRIQETHQMQVQAIRWVLKTYAVAIEW